MKHSAFTLIEMLIVMAILAVLSGIIFAAMGPAREQGRRQVCVSNLHQNGLAIAMYRADYDGQDAIVGVRMTKDQLGLPWGGDAANNNAFVFGYLKSQAIMTCPSYHGPPNTSGFEYTFLAGDDPGSDISPYSARDGERMITIGCSQHNANLGRKQLHPI